MKRNLGEVRRLQSAFAKQALLAFAAGSAAHFLFDALGRWPPLGWLAPVNESLWEHIKMAFWPILIIDGPAGRRLPSIEHGVVCTALSASISALLIIPLFYGYTGVWGEHYLMADIAVFAISVSSGHWVAYRVALGPVPSTASVLAACALALSLGVALIVFTYAPPPMEVFRDSLTGKFGLDG
jgi:hypothetical protein